MINRLKKILNPIIGVVKYDNYDISSDNIISTITKLCADTILTLKSDELEVIHNDAGDIDIIDNDKTYKIGIKTQNINKTYSFPNLISIKKAKDILTNHNNYIIYIFIEYEIKDNTTITNIRVQNIESLEWSYLYIQNLGKGQLQIKNMSKDEFKFNNDVTRSKWLNILKEKGIEYYDSLMLKVVEYKSEWENE